MKYYLEYIDDKISKFWELEIKGNAHILTYGIIGTAGQTTRKKLASTEEAKKLGKRLIDTKLKKGFQIKEEIPSNKVSWFERLSTYIINGYRAAIIKYPIKDYKYIQLNWTGQGFALGLSTNPLDDYHVYIDDGSWHLEELSTIDSVFRMVENIPEFEDKQNDISEVDRDFKREDWPKNATDCFELASFLINVSLGLAFMKLEKDGKTAPYLKNIEVIKICASERALGVFSYHFPDEKIKKYVIQLLIHAEKERKIVMDLWHKAAKNSGAKFLNYFNREVSVISKLSLQEAYEQAYDLEIRYKHKEAIEVLKEVLLAALENDNEDAILMEKCCDVMGQCSAKVRNGVKEAIHWFHKGLKFVPNGHSAVSMLEMYYWISDYDALITFGESHLESIDMDANIDHTVRCYRYLGKAYLQLMDQEKAKVNYQAILDFIQGHGKNWLLDYVLEDLECPDYVKEYD